MRNGLTTKDLFRLIEQNNRKKERTYITRIKGLENIEHIFNRKKGW